MAFHGFQPHQFAALVLPAALPPGQLDDRSNVRGNPLVHAPPPNDLAPVRQHMDLDPFWADFNRQGVNDTKYAIVRHIYNANPNQGVPANGAVQVHSQQHLQGMLDGVYPLMGGLKIIRSVPVPVARRVLRSGRQAPVNPNAVGPAHLTYDPANNHSVQPGPNPNNAAPLNTTRTTYLYTCTCRKIYLAGAASPQTLLQAFHFGALQPPNHACYQGANNAGMNNIAIQRTQQWDACMRGADNRLVVHRMHFPVQISLVSGSIMTEELLQNVVQNKLREMENEVNLNYLMAYVVGSDTHAGAIPFFVVQANSPADLVSCRVQASSSGVCWLDALVSGVNARATGTRASHAVITAQMRTVLGWSRGENSASSWDPRAEGVTVIELVTWAKTYRAMWAASLYVASLLGFTVGKFVCRDLPATRDVVRITLVMTSPTHVKVLAPCPKSRRLASPTAVYDSLFGAGCAKPSFDPESSELLLASSVSDLLARVNSLVLKPTTRVVRVVWFNAEDANSEFRDISDILSLAVAQSATRDSVYVPEAVWFTTKDVTVAVNDVVGFARWAPPSSPNRAVVWLLDPDYVSKLEFCQISAAAEFKMGLHFAPERVTCGYRSLAGTARAVLDDLLGIIPKSTFSPVLQRITAAHKCQHIIQTVDAITTASDAEDVIEFDLVKCYSNALASPGGAFPVFGPYDDFQLIVNGVEFFVLRGWATINSDTGDITYSLPPALWLVPDPIPVIGFPCPLTDLFYTTAFIEYLIGIGAVKVGDIHSVCVASQALPASTFSETVDTVFSLYPASLAKRLINSYTGQLGITAKHVSYSAFTDSREHAEMLFNSQHGIRPCHVSCLASTSVAPDPDLPSVYSVRCSESEDLYTTHVSIYMSVIAQSKIRLVALARHLHSLGARVRFLCVDSVGVDAASLLPSFLEPFANDQEVSFPIIGSVKVKTSIPAVLRRFTVQTPPIDVVEWKAAVSAMTNVVERTDLLVYPTGDVASAFPSDPDDAKADAELVNALTGCVVLGPGGSGKSHLMSSVIHRFLAANGDDTALALTQTGLLVNGEFRTKWKIPAQTFEYMTTFFEANRSAFFMKFERIGLLWVDELYRMTPRFVSLLRKWKDRNPDLRLFFGGDKDQVPGFDSVPKPGFPGQFMMQSSPVFDECSLVTNLASDRIITLTVNFGYCRFETEETLDDVEYFRKNSAFALDCGFLFPDQAITHSDDLASLVLTYSRKRRDEVNGLQLALYTDLHVGDRDLSDCIGTMLFDETTDVDSYNVADARWVSGMPVSCLRGFTTSLDQEMEDDDKATVYTGDQGVLLLRDCNQEGVDPLVFFVREGDNSTEVRLSRSELERFFTANWAMTIARFQGRAAPGEYVIEEAWRMDSQALYTCLSRTTRSDCVIVQPRCNSQQVGASRTYYLSRRWSKRDTSLCTVTSEICATPPLVLATALRASTSAGVHFVLGVTGATEQEAAEKLVQAELDLFEGRAATSSDPSMFFGLSKQQRTDIYEYGSDAFDLHLDSYDAPNAIQSNYYAAVVVASRLETMPSSFPILYNASEPIGALQAMFGYDPAASDRIAVYSPDDAFQASMASLSVDASADPFPAVASAAIPAPPAPAQQASSSSSSSSLAAHNKTKGLRFREKASRVAFASRMTITTLKKGPSAGMIRVVFTHFKADGANLKKVIKSASFSAEETSDSARAVYERCLKHLAQCVDMEKASMAVRPAGSMSLDEWRLAQVTELRAILARWVPLGELSP